MIKKIKKYSRQHPLILATRIICIALVITVFVNFMSNGRLYTSGLALVLFLTILDIFFNKK